MEFRLHDLHLQRFLQQLQTFNPAERDLENYRTCLGALLSAGGIEWPGVDAHTMQRLSMISQRTIADVLNNRAVMKLATELGNAEAIHYIYAMALRFESYLPPVPAAGLTSASKAQRLRWLQGTQNQRLILLQQGRELLLSHEHTPLEWLITLLDFKELEEFETL